jgi:hypothetical protein
MLELSADPVQTAVHLISVDYKGWTYGPDIQKHQIDCDQFIARVLEIELERPLSKEEHDAVLIIPSFTDLSSAVISNDPRTRGVQHAIVDVMRRGITVPASDAKSGDFIQYWMKKSDGSWFGHAGIISRVWVDENGIPRGSILGAHKSMGLGEQDFGGTGIGLTGKDRRIYIARLIRPH